MKLEIEQLFDEINNIPRIPEVVKDLILQINNPDIDFDDIAKNVEKEQVISMKVLRLVNSAHFGLSKNIDSINEAVVMLGMAKLKTLIIASGVVSSVPDIPNFNIQQFWSTSFRTATYSKWLAEACKHESPDMLFTVGLISDLGNLLIHLKDAKVANEIDQHVKAGNTRPHYERKRLGFTNQEACAELCRRWKFSDELIETLEKSADPLGFEELSSAACIASIAKLISECVEQDMDEITILAMLPKDEWNALGLSEDSIAEKLTDITALEPGLEGML